MCNRPLNMCDWQGSKPSYAEDMYYIRKTTNGQAPHDVMLAAVTPVRGVIRVKWLM